ncbi:MAG: DUF1385 domain-containing protein [Anaerolineae bacterium]
MAQRFNYGGQAVIEGVMMRGSRGFAVAVRDPEGQIVIHEEPISSSLYNGFWSRVPFVRGLGLLWDSLGLGMRALTFSADVAVGEEAEFSGPVAWGTIALSLVLGVALFFLAPAAAADGLHGLFGIESAFLGNLLEGVIRLIVVLAYIWGIGRMAEIQRVFQYHGAEHKTINAYEAGEPLTPESVARFPLEHPRCGTGFLLVVVVISVLVFALLGRPPIWLRLLSRVVLVPVIAGIAYEYIRFLARHLDKLWARILVQPQLWLQRLTTREPTPDMLEVGIAALERVLAAEHLLSTSGAGAADATPAEA